MNRAGGKGGAKPRDLMVFIYLSHHLNLLELLCPRVQAAGCLQNLQLRRFTKISLMATAEICTVFVKF